MPGEVQNYMAETTEKVIGDLLAAVEKLPEDKRSWKPMGKCRSALDQLAEVAILSGTVAQVIETRKWLEGFDFEKYEKDKNELAMSFEGCKSLLTENTPKITAAIRSVPDDALGVEVHMPWGAMPLKQIIAYPLWNASYHEGQVNYIGFLAAEPA